MKTIFATVCLALGLFSIGSPGTLSDSPMDAGVDSGDQHDFTLVHTAQDLLGGITIS